MKPKSKALTARKDHSWSAWHAKKDRFKRTGSTLKEERSGSMKGRSHISGNEY